MVYKMTSGSIRELSRRIGISDVAINKARESGRIPADLFARRESGRIYVVDLDRAEALVRAQLSSPKAGQERGDMIGIKKKGAYIPKLKNKKPVVASGKKIAKKEEKKPVKKTEKAAKQVKTKTVKHEPEPIAEIEEEIEQEEYSPRRPYADDLPSGGVDYQKARAVREAYSAKLTQMEYQEKIGDLIPRDELKIALFNAGRICRDTLTQIPTRIASQLAAEKDPHATQLMLATEINRALSELHDSLKKISPTAA